MATILLVDDSATFRMEMKQGLAAAGYSVLEAVDGEDGLNKGLQPAVDLIISDLNMPKMDGLTMCAHLRAHGSTAIIFLLTTQSTPELKAEAVKLSIKAWLIKPPNMASLLKGIAKVLADNGR